MHVSVGGVDVLRSSIEEFVGNLRSADVHVNLYLGEGMPHVFELFAMAIPAPRAELLPCCYRCCGCSWCCIERGPEVPRAGSLKECHPVRESLQQARDFVWSTAWTSPASARRTSNAPFL